MTYLKILAFGVTFLACSTTGGLTAVYLADALHLPGLPMAAAFFSGVAAGIYVWGRCAERVAPGAYYDLLE